MAGAGGAPRDRRVGDAVLPGAARTSRPPHPVRAGAHLTRALLAICREGPRTRRASEPERPALDARTHECAREARASPRTRACRAGRFCRPRARFCPTRHARREEPAPDNERRCSPRNSGSPKPLLTYQTASFSRRTFGVRRTAPTASSSKRNMRKRGPIGPRFRIFLLLDAGRQPRQAGISGRLRTVLGIGNVRDRPGIGVSRGGRGSS